jgi:putative FmdB family regulatory protein
MPIYEYVCDACGESTEALRKISDPPLEICPACGKAALRKKVSAAAFRLKGGGWYETDFKKSEKKKNLAGDTESSTARGSESRAGESGKGAETGTTSSTSGTSADKSSSGGGSSAA